MDKVPTFILNLRSECDDYKKACTAEYRTHSGWLHDVIASTLSKVDDFHSKEGEDSSNLKILSLENVLCQDQSACAQGQERNQNSMQFDKEPEIDPPVIKRARFNEEIENNQVVQPFKGEVIDIVSSPISETNNLFPEDGGLIFHIRKDIKELKDIKPSDLRVVDLKQMLKNFNVRPLKLKADLIVQLESEIKKRLDNLEEQLSNLLPQPLPKFSILSLNSESLIESTPSSISDSSLIEDEKNDSTCIPNNTAQSFCNKPSMAIILRPEHSIYEDVRSRLYDSEMDSVPRLPLRTPQKNSQSSLHSVQLQNSKLDLDTNVSDDMQVSPVYLLSVENSSKEAASPKSSLIKPEHALKSFEFECKDENIPESDNNDRSNDHSSPNHTKNSMDISPDEEKLIKIVDLVIENTENIPPKNLSDSILFSLSNNFSDSKSNMMKSVDSVNVAAENKSKKQNDLKELFGQINKAKETIAKLNTSGGFKKRGSILHKKTTLLETSHVKHVDSNCDEGKVVENLEPDIVSVRAEKSNFPVEHEEVKMLDVMTVPKVQQSKIRIPTQFKEQLEPPENSSTLLGKRSAPEVCPQAESESDKLGGKRQFSVEDLRARVASIKATIAAPRPTQSGDSEKLSFNSNGNSDTVKNDLDIMNSSQSNVQPEDTNTSVSHKVLSNLVSGFHSFTSLINRPAANTQVAPVRKIDVPALRKAAETKIHQEKQNASRLALREHIGLSKFNAIDKTLTNDAPLTSVTNSSGSCENKVAASANNGLGRLYKVSSSKDDSMEDDASVTSGNSQRTDDRKYGAVENKIKQKQALLNAQRQAREEKEKSRTRLQQVREDEERRRKEAAAELREKNRKRELRIEAARKERAAQEEKARQDHERKQAEAEERRKKALTQKETIASTATQQTKVPLPNHTSENRVHSSKISEILDKSYEMSDRIPSSEEECEDDEEVSGQDPKKSRKPVPNWARGSPLKRALEGQYSKGALDPDLIFEDVPICDLDSIFSKNPGRYGRRGSSANWDRDMLTTDEVNSYRQANNLLDPSPLGKK